MTTIDKTTVLFGEALVDDFATGKVVGGAPFNVARHLAALNMSQLMVTRIGQDRNGELVRAEFARFDMSDAGLQVDPVKDTGHVVVESAGGTHRFIILPDQAYDFIAPDAALAAMASVNPATIYFGTLAQRGACSRATLAQMLGTSSATRYLDLNLREGSVNERCVFNSLHQANIVKVSEEELDELFSWFTHTRPRAADIASDEVRDTCVRLLRVFALEGLIVTRGPRGSVYFGADGAIIVTDGVAPPRQLVDTVGAGDAFSAIFLLGRTQGWPLELTLARANEFASAVCGLAGAVPTDLAFYHPFLSSWG